MTSEEIRVIYKNRDSEFVKLINPKYIKFNVIEENKEQKQLLFEKEEFDFNKKLKFIIWELLNDNPNILQFYGINFESVYGTVLVENPEFGDLETIYSTKNITWATKVYISIGICRGLIFLHACNIFHRNIRCGNVAIDNYFTPKLCNFDNINDLFVKIKNKKSVMVNWLAPEILKNGDKYYNFCIDVFSLGMLLWELLYEKIPYQNYSVSDIFEHVVINKKRESVNIENRIGNKSNQYIEIILSAWHNDSMLRPNLQQICGNLFYIYEHVKNEKLEITELKKNQIEIQENNCIDEFMYSSVMPLSIQDGIIMHKEKKCKFAFACFNYHEALGCPLAKYWKGYYLFEGICCEKDVYKASELFKEAADFGMDEGQLRYEDEFKDQFVKYVKLSAEGGNITARYNLGDMFLKGKYVESNKELGIKYMKLAAYCNHPKALNFLRNTNYFSYN